MVLALIQYVAAGCSWLLLQLNSDFQIEGVENIRRCQKPLLIVSNHESHLDPQLIGSALLYAPHLFPQRYMAKSFTIPGANLLLRLLGAFKVHKGQGLEKALAVPNRVIASGGVVAMFPEGKIIKERGTLGPGKRGAAALALQNKVTILPMSLHTPYQLSLWRFLFTPRSSKKIKITIGEPFALNYQQLPGEEDEKLMAGTNIIMRQIEELYERHLYA